MQPETTEQLSAMYDTCAGLNGSCRCRANGKGQHCQKLEGVLKRSGWGAQKALSKEIYRMELNRAGGN